MEDVTLLVEWLQDLEQEIHTEIEPLSQEALVWQPAPQANSIGITVWHFSRWLDVLATQAIQNLPASEEQWHQQGWAAKTGYDPRGIGLYGIGAISGYTWEEVEAIPALSTEETLLYFDQAREVLIQQLKALPDDVLHKTAPGLNGQRTIYGWVKSILKGCLKHLGEIQALKTIQRQTTELSLS